LIQKEAIEMAAERIQLTIQKMEYFGSNKQKLCQSQTSTNKTEVSCPQ